MKETDVRWLTKKETKEYVKKLNQMSRLWECQICKGIYSANSTHYHDKDGNVKHI